jgi:alpha,alpha-trehalose phosphorylase
MMNSDATVGSGYLHPVEPWSLSEHAFDIQSSVLNETLFALGNGYIGLRGAHEEGFTAHGYRSLDGTYLNGFYESDEIQYPEPAYGLARHHQFMLNVPNAKAVRLFVDGDLFSLLHGTIERYERCLDFREGVLKRTIIWRSPNGRRVEITSGRLVSFTRKHLFALQYKVRSLDGPARVQLVSALDGMVSNLETGDDPRVGTAVSGPRLELANAQLTDDLMTLTHRTQHSGFMLVSAVHSDFTCDGIAQPEREFERSDQRLEQRFSVDLSAGQSCRLTKFGAYCTSRDFPEDRVMAEARNALQSGQDAGFEALCREQESFLEAFWRQADVEIAGDDAVQQGIHFNQYHLLQSVGRDGKTNIAAKGVTGEGYSGHYFWDSETYVFPFFLFTKPDIARCLLQFRYEGLEQARERACELSRACKPAAGSKPDPATGALYPWRTIGGEECSAYFPAGTAQYHINADIAYSIKLYEEATGDTATVYSHGAEIVMQTARIWIDIGCYVEKRGGRFCIHEVTGPDEYSALVNNNYYTNAMAKMHLQYAAELAERMRAQEPEAFLILAERIQLRPDEPTEWRRAAELMYLPYDDDLRIHPQDDSFLYREKWDFDSVPPDTSPLLLHFHPLVIYRYQICKQADVVLALLLLGQWFSAEDKRRDFDYYEAVTTHDSSLSGCIFGVIAAEVGYREKAYRYFMETARLDLDDTHGNTETGVHTAAMAGTWMGVVYGFAGMRLQEGRLRFAPYLPGEWTHYKFKIRFRECLLQVHVDKQQTVYTLLEGDAVEFDHQGHAERLTSTAPTQTVGGGAERPGAHGTAGSTTSGKHNAEMDD